MKRMNTLITAFLILLITVSCSNEKKATKKLDTEKLLEYCVEKAQVTIMDLNDVDSLPRNIYPGQKKWNKVGNKDWTCGFWPGVLWYAYEASHDSTILKSAKNFIYLQ